MDKLAKIILAFMFLFFLVYALPEIIPLGEFWDIVVQAPFVALFAMIFYKFIVVEKNKFSSKKMFLLQTFMVLSFFIFFEGHGMHFTANNIEVLMAESLPFIHLASLTFPLSNPTAQIYFWTIYSKIYYFDEMLGHQLVYTGFLLLLVSGMILELWMDEHKSLGRADYVAIIISGGVAGFLVVQAVTEGQFVPQSIVLSIGVFGVFLLASKGGASLKESPFTLFVVISVILLLAGLLIYGLATDPVYATFVGRWPPPSEAKRLLTQFLAFNYWEELGWLLLLL